MMIPHVYYAKIIKNPRITYSYTALSRKTYGAGGSIFGVFTGFFPHLLHEAFEQWFIFDAPLFLKKVWSDIFPIITWSIWKERNSRIFRSISCSLSQIKDLILTRLSWWIKGWGSSFPYTCDEIIRNPISLSWYESRSSHAMVALISDALWIPPSIETIKWNVDASVNPLLSMSAIGGVLRNNMGHCICVFSIPIPPIEMNSAAVMAIFRAINPNNNVL